jgi:hypothetical protein
LHVKGFKRQKSANRQQALQNSEPQWYACLLITRTANPKNTVATVTPFAYKTLGFLWRLKQSCRVIANERKKGPHLILKLYRWGMYPVRQIVDRMPMPNA